MAGSVELDVQAFIVVGLKTLHGQLIDSEMSLPTNNNKNNNAV